MDNKKLSFSLEGISWDTLAEVYRLAPLGNYRPEKLKEAYLNSSVCCFIYVDGRLVAAGRAISDGVYFATICDVAVHPKFQGKGLGREILDAMVEKLSVPKILLACVIGQEGFYRKQGFLKHKSVMAKYPNVEWFKEHGYLE